uniref:Uncharacterized protein n=1 Tax=Oryza sativa subsp. japonica TaxID=39947 RepID=Q8H5L7_ORYSJ|nr:hypothetical protein [Oryza sativa Japonica Group]
MQMAAHVLYFKQFRLRRRWDVVVERDRKRRDVAAGQLNVGVVGELGGEVGGGADADTAHRLGEEPREHEA